MASSGAPRAFLHVGLPKTGTSYLQSLVWANLAELRRQGLVVVPDPGTPASAESSARLMHALRGRLVAGHDDATSAEVLDRFAAEVAAAGDADVLLTQEQLAGCRRPQVRTLLDRLAGREVHVVVTARAVSRQVPSAWQERVKSRSTISYSDFVLAARDRTEAARGFWRNQDLLDVLARWGEALPPEQVHVVTVPLSGAGRDELAHRYCGVLGVDAARLELEQARSNSSLGFTQAELLRRVNLALGERLPKPRLGYARVARWYLTEKFLLPQGGRAPLLPQSAEAWCRALSQEWIDGIRRAGYAVTGDLADLLPDAAHFSADLPEAAETDQLDAAVRALADLLVDRHEEIGRLDALHAHVRELESQQAHQTQQGEVSAPATAASRRGRWRARAPWRGRR
ncbi:MAG TPA: hypothetical protein VHO29_05520 [Marmoricola sp.]|nr:hypothetical protein [Marmoricola sp.]